MVLEGPTSLNRVFFNGLSKAYVVSELFASDSYLDLVILHTSAKRILPTMKFVKLILHRQPLSKMEISDC